MCRKEAELFKVLGVESRIRIIDLLKQRGPLGVNEMAQTLGITPSAVSQHLKILRLAGLVRNQRKGFWIPYEVDHEKELADLKRREQELEAELQELRTRMEKVREEA
jgi:DNA-binding transcriptional ArsR family regulator